MADLPDILKGPGMDIVSGLALGAFMGNPLLGLALAPQVNRMRRGGEAGIAKTKAATDAQLFETAEQKRLSKLAQSIPMLAGAGKNPVTGHPMDARAMDGDPMDPYMDEAQKLGLAAQFSHLEPTLRPQQQGGRLNARQIFKLAEEKGIDLSEDQQKAILGALEQGVDPQTQLEMMRLNLQIQDMFDELDRGRQADADKEAAKQIVLRRANLDMDKSYDGSVKALGHLDYLMSEGGVLRPGSGFTEEARKALGSIEGIKNFFGKGDAEAERIFTAYDELNKNLALVTGQTVESFDQLGNITDQKFRLVANAAPSMDITGDAMRTLILDNLEGRVDAVDVTGTGYERVGDVRGFIAKQRERPPYSRRQGAGGEAIDATQAAIGELVTQVASGAADMRSTLDEQLRIAKQNKPDITDEELQAVAEWFTGLVRSAQSQGEGVIDSARGAAGEMIEDASAAGGRLMDQMRGIDRNSVEQRIQDAVNI